MPKSRIENVPPTSRPLEAEGRSRSARPWRGGLSVAVLLAAGAAPELMATPMMTVAPGFGQVQVTRLPIQGAMPPGGTTGVAVLPQERVYNNQRLPAGTVLTMLGPVVGGDPFRIYAVNPDTGALIPSLAVSYGPASLNGFPDAGLLLLENDMYLAMEYAPMGVVLGRFQRDGPGEALSEVFLPVDDFPNGGGIGLLDQDTLYITSYERRTLWTADFRIVEDQLQLDPPVLLNADLGGPGPDGIAIIPPNAAGELADYAGNLILARFGGRGEGYVDVVDREGRFLRRLATFDPGGSRDFIGPDGVTFGPDGTLWVSDFDRALYKFTEIPEPLSMILLMLLGLGILRRS